jgi:replicative DNA helicase
MSDGTKLVAAILAAGAVDALRTVDREWLLEDELRVYDFVRLHYRRYSVLPAVPTVEEELGERLPVVHETVDYYKRRVSDRRLYNELRGTYRELQTHLKDHDLEQATNVVAQMRNITRVFTPNEDLRTLQEAGDGVMRHYEDAHHRRLYGLGISGIPTGWPTIDAMTGGYQNGDLVSWVARMGSGKTYSLLAQALGAWRGGYSVLIVTMEMTIEQIARRALGIEAGINPDYIRKGAVSTPKLNRLRRVIDTLQHADRFNLYAGGFSKRIDDVELLIEEMTPDIIFIDGAYLLNPSSGGRMNRIEKVATVYDELKKMTITRDRPIVTTSQFSRAAGKRGKDGSLETISFTDAIGMHSSLVFSLKEGTPPYQQSRREIEILKGREGEHGTFQINYRFQPPDFSEIPKETQQTEQTDVDWMAPE